jgi:tetratricopeptide (TPR) repeat protein
MFPAGTVQSFLIVAAVALASATNGADYGLANRVWRQETQASKKPYECLLQGGDLKKAEELNDQIGALIANDDLARAMELQEKLLALRVAKQGADHWETIDEKWSLDGLKKLTASSPKQRKGYRDALWNDPEPAAEAKGNLIEVEKRRREALRQRALILGEDHPETGTSHGNVALNLQYQARYTEARSAFQKALEIHQRVLKEDHPETAASYHKFADLLLALGEYKQADDYLRSAHEIRRRILGPLHPDTLQTLEGRSKLLHEAGRYQECRSLLQSVLEIRKAAYGENDVRTSHSYQNLGIILGSEGQYAEASVWLEKALAIRLKHAQQDPSDLADTYRSLGYNRIMQGQFESAQTSIEKALEIYIKLFGKESFRAVEASIMHASNLINQRDYSQAEKLLKETLDNCLARHGDDELLTTTIRNNLGLLFQKTGKLAEAEVLLLRALTGRQKRLGNEHPETATCHFNLAVNYCARGLIEKAQVHFDAAEKVIPKWLGEHHPLTVKARLNAALPAMMRKDYSSAEAALRNAAKSYESARLGVSSRGLGRAEFGIEHSPYRQLAFVQARREESIEAWQSAEAYLARGLLDEYSAGRGVKISDDEERERIALNQQIQALNGQVKACLEEKGIRQSSQSRLGPLLDKRRSLESELATLGARVSKRELADLSQVQAALPENVALIFWIDSTETRVASGDHWGCVVRSKGNPHWALLPGSGANNEWTQSDTELPQEFRLAITGDRDVSSASVKECKEVSDRLYAQRIAPLEGHLEGVKRLVVIPTGYMAGVPIEGFAENFEVSYVPSGSYLARTKGRGAAKADQFLIVGDPEFTPHDRDIRKAIPKSGLLVIRVLPTSIAEKARLVPGDVLMQYGDSELTTAEELKSASERQMGLKQIKIKIWRDGREIERFVGSGNLGVVLDKRPAQVALPERRKKNNVLQPPAKESDWTQLPGTLAEIAQIRDLLNGKAILWTGADAAEEKLERYRQQQGLQRFRFLHFATHGQANNRLAFESRLVLARPQAGQVPLLRPSAPLLDGYLTASEVLDHWNLDAELVTLSSCESGLGKAGAGDGLLGFAQAFLKAGSRSVCLSLWQADDDATCLLMARFYENYLIKKLGKAQALDEAKRWLRALSFQEASRLVGALYDGSPSPIPGGAANPQRPYAHPKYWSAFVLIGDPD